MAAKKKTKLSDFADFSANLTPVEREAIQRTYGVVLPISDPESEPGRIVWTYSCPHCNRDALEFVGTRFQSRRGGYSDAPDPSLPLSAMPWTQMSREAHKIDRLRPTCQHCSAGIHLRNGNCIPRLFRRAGESKEIDAIIEKHRKRSRPGTHGGLGRPRRELMAVEGTDGGVAAGSETTPWAGKPIDTKAPDLSQVETTYIPQPSGSEFGDTGPLEALRVGQTLP